jgi:hypothetical protein
MNLLRILNQTVFVFMLLAVMIVSCSEDEEPFKELPNVIVSSTSTNEGSDLEFEITMDTISVGPVEVDYETQDGSATSGEDYTSATGTVIFAPGERSKTVSITTISDSENENDETISLVLTSAINAKLKSSMAIGTINNVAAVNYFMTAKIDGVIWEAKDQFGYALRFSEASNFISGASAITISNIPVFRIGSVWINIESV